MSMLIMAVLVAVALAVVPAFADGDGWYAFSPRNEAGGGAMDMSDWLDKPAGSHGFITLQGDALVFEDGTPVKLWGINHGNWACAPEAADADARAERYPQFGINAVRMHKFTWRDGGLGRDDISTQLTDEGWARLDYYVARLAENGLYHGWSHIYGHRPRPGDAERLAAYDEIANLQLPWGHLSRATTGLVNFAPDLQTLNIELTVNMLNHVNPHTGRRYADEPALAFIELQNEDDIFWSAIERSLEQCPTYRTMLCEQFSDWLAAKYGSHEALMEAWGGEGLLSDDAHLSKRNLYPRPDHGWFSAESEAAVAEGRPIRPHYLDRAAFLYERQVDFYTRFVQAIRETGYRGVIIGSCWQAGSGLTHFYNLAADAEAGMIDRHNYFGGSGGHGLQPGPVRLNSMLERPGSGILGTGMQQVLGRPFAISEWMSLIPNPWVAEGPAIVGVYGMGLQGWDASFHFAMGTHTYSRTIQGHGGGNIYNATSPTQMGQYPTLARMIYRGDVAEAPVVVRQAVPMSDLAAGTLHVDQRVRQTGDEKDFAASTALAVGRVVVDFADSAQPATPTVPLTGLLEEGRARSVTGQLDWRFGARKQSYFTVDTDATKAVVGFAPAEPIALGEVTVTPSGRFASLFITARGPGQTLADADSLVVTAFARARNTGMRFSEDSKQLLELGDAPVEIEPVRATVKLARPGFTVHVLDHDGHRTGRTLSVTDGQFTLDGAADRTPFYEIAFE